MDYKTFDRNKAMARTGGGEARFREVAAFFPEYVTSLVGPLDLAYRHGNKQALKDAAHKIKGSLGMLGADAAMEWAQKLENIAMQDRPEDLSHTFEGLHSALAELLAELNHYIKG